jgi:hypothetical protein
MMPLVQWLLIGLALALASLPLVRWFWKRWDKPTPEMIARDEEQREQIAEARVWAATEAKIDAEAAKKYEWAEIQMAKAVALVKAKPLNKVSASKAWDALGVDEPIIISTAPEVDVSDLLDQEETTIESEEPAVESEEPPIESEEPPVESEEKVEVPSMLDLPVIPSVFQVSTEDEFSQGEPSSEISVSEDSEKHVIEHFAAPVRQRNPDLEDDWHEVLW